MLKAGGKGKNYFYYNGQLIDLTQINYDLQTKLEDGENVHELNQAYSKLYAVCRALNDGDDESKYDEQVGEWLKVLGVPTT